MATKPANTEKEETPAAPVPEFTPEMAKLTPEQQRVAEFIKTAKADAPVIEVGKNLSAKIAMAVPMEVRRGPEYSYAWLSIADMDQSLHAGSKWELVSRNNHSHAPGRYFGADGAITYKGQNILAFCHRRIQEAEQVAIVEDYNKKTERITTPQADVKEGEVVRLGDAKAAGKIVQANELTPDETYDFSET